MCLAIYSRGKSAIPQKYIDAAFERHPDGYGVAYVEDGQVRTAKFAPSERRAFRKRLRAIERRKQPFAAHWRYATQGPVSREMSHPYTYDDPVEGTVAILHNGVINIKADKTESDTLAFVRLVLAELPSRWWMQPALRFLVSQSIGWSKLVVVTPNDGILLVNESGGTWDGNTGIWYSSAYKPSPPTKASTPYKWAPSAPPKGKDAPTGKGWQMIPATTPDNAHVKDASQSVAPMLTHAGHALETLKPLKADGKDCAVKRAVKCLTCGTFGDVYRIENQRYIELAHKDSATLDPLFAAVSA